jgi:hypothetical protein
MGEMNVSIYLKGYYVEFYGFGLRENKANPSGTNCRTGLSEAFDRGSETSFQAVDRLHEFRPHFRP